MKFVALYFLFMTLLAFSLFGLDKSAAVHGRRRIAERTLHVLAALGGWPGACLGQYLFRHKTRKAGFIRTLYAAAAVNIAVVLTVLHWFLKEGL